MNFHFYLLVELLIFTELSLFENNDDDYFENRSFFLF